VGYFIKADGGVDARTDHASGTPFYFGQGGSTSTSYIEFTKKGVIGLYDWASGAGGTFKATPRTPGQITSDQNDYNPGGYSLVQRWSSDASRNVTGLTFATAQVGGEFHLIRNVGSQNIVLKHENAGSSAANRFHCTTGADVTLSADQQALVDYDDTISRWRVSKMN